jgi:hypothetical protein
MLQLCHPAYHRLVLLKVSALVVPLCNRAKFVIMVVAIVRRVYHCCKSAVWVCLLLSLPLPPVLPGAAFRLVQLGDLISTWVLQWREQARGATAILQCPRQPMAGGGRSLGAVGTIALEPGYTWPRGLTGKGS